MTWTRIDDQLHAHPKVQHAWHAEPAALGLHLLALSHAGCYLTDGHVSETFVRTHLASPARRRRAIGALVGAGLWEARPDGWQIHDFLHFNEARDDVLARREEISQVRADAGRKGAASRWQTDGKPMAPAPALNPTPNPFS